MTIQTQQTFEGRSLSAVVSKFVEPNKRAADRLAAALHAHDFTRARLAYDDVVSTFEALRAYNVDSLALLDTPARAEHVMYLQWGYGPVEAITRALVRPQDADDLQVLTGLAYALTGQLIDPPLDDYNAPRATRDRMIGELAAVGQ